MPADAQETLDCLQQAFAPYRDSYTELAFADTVLTPETLSKRFFEMQILVATDETGRVVGTIAYSVTNGEGHLRGMAVKPELHGSGVAQSLLDQAESDLRQLRCTVITLDTTKPLGRAIRFYEKNGFRPTGEVAAFFGMEIFEYRKKLKSQKPVAK